MVTIYKNGSGKFGKNLYLVSVGAEVNFGGYDTFDAFIACADSEREVREMHPDGQLDENDKGTNWDGRHNSWIKFSDIDKLEVELIGTAKNQVKGVVIASYNAG